jgi:hypothetical protein
MRARKIAILLTITAVSALTMFLILLVDSDAFGAEPGPQSSPCVSNIKWSDRKALVEVLAVLGDGGSGDLRLPFVFEDACDFKILSGQKILSVPGGHPVNKEGL